MKIIISRKGIDGGNGGRPSPLIRNTRGELVPVSIPIGGQVEKWRYPDINVHGHNLWELTSSLGVRGKHGAELKKTSPVHFDPDLDIQSVSRKKGWKPLFGQCSRALRHLEKKSVTKDDLFLFFGWFKETDVLHQRIMYKKDADNIQAFFGWLQIGDVWKVGGTKTENLRVPKMYPEWGWAHPHFRGENGKGYGHIFVAANNLAVGGKTTNLPGAGVFRRFTERAQLTWPKEKRSIWKLPSFFHKKGEDFLSYHKKEERWKYHDNSWQLQSAFRGQEFILDVDKLDLDERKAASDWAFNLIKEHA
jgi:hypothetical protein